MKLKPDFLLGLTNQCKLHIPRKAMLIHGIFFAIHTILFLIDTSDEREQHR